MATAGSIVVDLLMRTGSFETDSKRAEKRLKDFQKEAAAAGKALGAGAAVAGAALAAVTWDAIQFADQLDEMSNRLGISSETLSGWGYAAKMSGTDLESLTSALPKLSKTLAAAADDGSKAGELFKALGIDAVDAAGNLRDVEEVLPEIADRFKALKNDTAEAAIAQELFGRSGAEMLEFLNRGSDGIEELTDRAAKLGIVVSGETAASAAKLNDRLDDLKAISRAFGLEIAELVVPQLTRLVDWLVDSHQEGKLLGFEIEDLGDAVNFFGDEMSKADGIGESFKATISGMKAAAASLGDALVAVADLDFQRFKSSFGDYWDSASGALDAAVNGVPAQRRSRRVNFSDERDMPRSMQGDGLLPDRLPDINRWLAGAGGGKGGSGKSKSPYSLADSLTADREALARLLEEEERARDQFEAWAAQLAGPVADANYQYARDLEELNALAVKGTIGTDDLTKAQESLRKEHERNVESIQQRLEPGRELLKDLQFEYDLMKLTNAERATAIQLRGLEADQIAKYGEDIAEANRKIFEQSEQVDFMDSWRGEFQDFFSDVLTGTKSIGDAFEDMLSNISAMILDRIAQNWVDQLFGQMGTVNTGSAGGDWFSTVASIFSSFGGSKAGGGDVLASRGYWVGEQGPEWFQPRTAGTVLPNGESMAMAGGRQRSVRVEQHFHNPVMNNRETEAQKASRQAAFAARQLERRS